MENNNTIVETKIREISAGFSAELVEIKISLFNGVTAMYCVVDYPHGGINLETCAHINKAVVRYLEESALFGEDFSIEVNSPGLDRKLKNPLDFKRVSGRAVMLWFDNPVYEKTYWEGEMEFINNEKISLKVKDKALAINIADIKTAKEKIVF
jgi:ribosome maturation factor RimP